MPGESPCGRSTKAYRLAEDRPDAGRNASGAGEIESRLGEASSEVSRTKSFAGEDECRLGEIESDAGETASDAGEAARKVSKSLVSSELRHFMLATELPPGVKMPSTTEIDHKEV